MAAGREPVTGAGPSSDRIPAGPALHRVSAISRATTIPIASVSSLKCIDFLTTVHLLLLCQICEGRFSGSFRLFLWKAVHLWTYIANFRTSITPFSTGGYRFSPEKNKERICFISRFVRSQKFCNEKMDITWRFGHSCHEPWARASADGSGDTCQMDDFRGSGAEIKNREAQDLHRRVY